ncbi:MAG: hypothetical protein RR405_02910 [Clostridia bacterium]
MKTRMYFGKLKTSLMAIAAVGALTIIILDIIMLTSDILRTSTPAVAGASLGAAIIVFVAAILMLFNSFYRFKDDNLLIVFGFFADKLMYENIVGIKENNNTKEIFITYKNDEDGDGEQFIRLNLMSRSSEKFLEALREKCPFVIIEPFTPPDKKKKKK